MLTQTQLDKNLFTHMGKLYNVFECRYLQRLLTNTISWQTDYQAFGRRFDIPRLQAWYADAGIHYRYSDNLLARHSWVPTLLSIKERVENASGHTFNSVLLTYYRTGRDHVTWHADDEPELGDQPVIASLSLGATRTFHWRSKQGKASSQIPLKDGELLLMNPEFQHYWEHSIPADYDISAPRINLTFRKVILNER